MDTLAVLLGLLSLVIMPICLIMIVVQAIRRKSKKKWVIIMVGSFCGFVMSVSLTITSMCDHVWKEATCEIPKTCSLCGDYEGDALCHDFGEFELVREATCTEVGSREGCCVRCGEVVEEEIPKKEHSMGGKKIIKEATCEAPGEIELKCECCGYIEKEIILATGHTEGKWEITDMATYDHAGMRSVFCVKCNDLIKSETYELSEEEKKIAFLEMCEAVDYEGLARYPEKFIDKPITFEGEVIQVVEDDGEYTLRVDITWNGYFYEDTVWVEYTKQESDDGRILEGDIITVYGLGMDMKDYTSVMFTTISIPAVSAWYVYY